MSYIYNLVKDKIDIYNTADPFELCDYYGIYLKYSENLTSLSGMFTIMNDVPVVIINAKLDDVVQRMVCAHELGHFFLHSDIARERCLQEFHIFNMRDKIEYEANIFAAHLLINDDEMLDLLKRHTGSQYL